MKFGKKDAAKVKTIEPEQKKKSKPPKSTNGALLNAWAWQPVLLSLAIIAGIAVLLELLYIAPTESQLQKQQHEKAILYVKSLVDAHIDERIKVMEAAVAQSPAAPPLSDLTEWYSVAASELKILRNQYPSLSFASVDILRSAAEKQQTLVEGFFHEKNWYFQVAMPLNTGEINLAIFGVKPLLPKLKIPSIYGPGEISLVAGSNGAMRKVLSLGEGGGDVVLTKPTRIPQWQLQYVSGSNGAISLDRIVPLIVLGVGGLLLALALMLLVRVRMASVKQSLQLATRMMRNAVSGEGKKNQLLAFAELNSMVAAVSQAARQIPKSQPEKPTQKAEEVPQSGDDAPLFEDDLLDLDVLAEAESGLDGIVADSAYQESETGAIVEEVQQLDVPQSIFRAYDIRGVVNETLNEGIVELIGKALASEALSQGHSTLCVGYDGRLSSVAYCEAITRGIVSTGANAIIIGQVPTPVLYYATHHFETGTGVMITGSHNPSNYNGFKMMIGGNTLSGEDIQKLYNRIVLQDFAQGQGERSEQPVERDYLDTILDDIAVAAPLKVVVDAGNGVAGGIAPTLIEELGCEVIPLYCEVDGNFPNHHPDPGKPENLKDLIAAVQEHEADIGLAFDGDGDRVGVVTNAGKIIWPDRLLMLFAKDVVARNPGADIIYDVKCSRRLSALITGYGGRPVMWKTGHSLIKAKMKETGALLAGEMSGHVFFKERWYGFDDGLYSAARLLEILGVDDRPSDAVFADFPEDVSTPEINITVTDESKFSIVEKLCAQKDQFAEANVSTIDGLRVDYPNGWGLCRASNTTPVLVLRFEADDEQALESIKDAFKRVLAQVDDSLDLNF
ncbi:MAG: phosphomannomutase/phosphoglucomutase [Oleiphilaceae bacterium]|nr:phosphomannomutase/phosphoglucomutase [Oleiphilaceae bacterium]